MRITQLVALGGIAVLAGCNDARPSATGPISEGPSLTVYTASAAAPVILEAYNGSPYTIPSGINDLGAVTGESPAGTVVLWEMARVRSQFRRLRCWSRVAVVTTSIAPDRSRDTVAWGPRYSRRTGRGTS
jgi:hypothetical protein